MSAPVPGTHTPGPWGVVLSAHARGHIREVHASKDGLICRMTHQNHRTAKRLDANTRLIASAPALLEAAQNYMAQIGQGYEAHGLPFGPAQQAAHERLTQAIASATGEA